MLAMRFAEGPAAVVSVPGLEPVTAIALYGLLDERSDASIHRSLSDLSPLLDDTRYNRYLLLGGDLNTLASAPAGSRYLAKDQGVLDRITGGFGLIDLLRSSLQKNDPDRGRLAGCECSLGDDCKHTWTYRKGKVHKGRYQDDYLFASAALEERLIDCVALPFTPDTQNDHAPIVATFED